jgi:hypothetical protein
MKESDIIKQQILIGETTLPENIMLLRWKKFSKVVEQWISKHGKETGYDRPGGFNAADMWKNPLGWFQDAGKYCIEGYAQADRPIEEWDNEKLMRLCWKIAHCAEIAFSRVVERGSSDPQKGDCINPD